MRTIKMGNIYKCIEVAVIIIVIFAVTLCTYLLLGGNNEQVVFNTEDVYTGTDGWTVNDIPLNDEEPVYIDGHKGQSFVIHGVVPEDVEDDWSCMVYAQYARIDIYVDNTLIKSYGRNLPFSFGHMVGNIRVMAPVDSSMAGHPMSIIVAPYYDMNFDTYTPTFGPHYSLIIQIIKYNMFRAIVIVFMLIILLICAVVYFIQKSLDLNKDSELVLHFAAFVMCILLWMICSSDIPQFYTDASEGISFVSFLSLSMMCISLLGFLKSLLPMGTKVFEVMWTIGWLLPLANMLCFILNICDPMNLLIFSHIYIIATILALTYFSIKSWRTSKDVKLLALGVGILVVAAIAGLALFYSNSTKGYDAIAFSIGFMSFFTVIIVMIVKRQFVFFTEKKFMETYKELAYHDAMTSLENRTSFDGRFSSMTRESMGGKYITLLILDLNDLKKTNDEIGHWAGDRAIIGLGECIKSIFGTMGDTYRIGGDEFAVILIDKHGQEQGLLKDFDRFLCRFNDRHEIHISVSYGYETRLWSDDDEFFREIYKEADRKMYDMKLRIKKAN